MTEEQTKKARAMGEIKVSLKRGTVGEVTHGRGRDISGKTEKVHEKALKGRAMSRKAGSVQCLCRFSKIANISIASVQSSLRKVLRSDHSRIMTRPLSSSTFSGIDR